MPPTMARLRAVRRTSPATRTNTVRVNDESLEFDVAGRREIDLLRRWVSYVNGPTYPQPYLVEGPPGHFRLYVGAAAEQVRTRHGIV